MKRILMTLALFAGAASFAGAQNMYDAIMFSQNNYGGTARTMGMGNAVAAVGGDLGSIGINPAGSAIARYGQVTITPGLSISAVSSAYSPSGTTSFGSPVMDSRTRFALPNIGMSFVTSTGNSRGLKRLTFSVVSNSTADYNSFASAFGLNSRTSKIAELATGAEGISESVLANYNSFNNSNVSWDVLTAYQGGMIGGYGIKDKYVGVTERIDPSGTYHFVPSNLSQASYVTRTGRKNDLVFNFGADYNDDLFVGLNIGLPSATYNYLETFYETPVNMEEFPVSFIRGGKVEDTYFQKGAFDYQYVADIRGLYAKVGVIYMPTRSLRVAAAVQTPTIYTVSETWQYSASTTFENNYYNQSQSSPVGEYTYNLLSPYVVDLGVAYTLGKSAVVSVDYELADFGVMRFSEIGNRRYDYSNDSFRLLNDVNRNFAGLAHNVRVGAEVKLNPAVSARAGYNLSTYPEKHWTNSKGDDVTASDYQADYGMYQSRVLNLVKSFYYRDIKHAFSFGLGYSSSGSFFADLAAMCTMMPSSIFAPYYDYVSCDKNGNASLVESPRIRNNASLWEVALTLGWRF